MAKKFFTIVETSVFTKRVKSAMSDEEYRAVQMTLAANPNAGAVIPGSGGIRKLRWGSDHRGKSGSYRIIYYSVVAAELVLMLYLYSKNEAGDLTREQVKMLAEIVREEYK